MHTKFWSVIHAAGISLLHVSYFVAFMVSFDEQMFENLKKLNLYQYLPL